MKVIIFSLGFLKIMKKMTALLSVGENYLMLCSRYRHEVKNNLQFI
ncbi:unknown [[Mannheimia] succiniciproducens MBEL55E]|uniref:Uncharacterized protein n=1 Tax=Mannheimia succiniciproducens (strain KCTC 0769BP / MBEL55E) TaxID=221988 RepID=Q65UP8_MANSM|nr:unknown [[Mannheimia] succiniciproducens MBEL55E]